MASLKQRRERLKRRMSRAHKRVWREVQPEFVFGRCTGCGVLFERETRARKEILFCSPRCRRAHFARTHHVKYEQRRVEAADALRLAGVTQAPPPEASTRAKVKYVTRLDQDLKRLGVRARVGHPDWFTAALRETLAYGVRI